MAVVVTGAKGFIGQNLMIHLRERGVDAVGFELGDDPAAMIEALAGADFVFHLAGVNRPETEDEFETGNAGLTGEVCRVLAEAGNCAPVVITSSTQAERDNSYGRSKLAAERAVLAHREASLGDVGEDIYGNSQAVKSAQLKPLVAHCSAGVGRTGAFLASLVCLERYELEKKVDIFAAVKHMRTQRTTMVQTPDQYEFVYKVLLAHVDREFQQDTSLYGKASALMRPKMSVKMKPAARPPPSEHHSSSFSARHSVVIEDGGDGYSGFDMA
jgi:hypothetical protein